MSEQSISIIELERPILALETRLKALDPNNIKEVEQIQNSIEKMKSSAFSHLSDWQVVQLARHSKRPYIIDYVERICDQFEEIHGDRSFGDDRSIITGMGWLHDSPIMVIGQQKGRGMKEKMLRNFGMSKPEGYRKALRCMKMAEKFNRPILCLIDTYGAYPGLDAEERGQAEAIARNLREMAKLKVPIISVIVGEGGSGGALALGVANLVFMFQYAIYSVITPEGCASILWKDILQAPAAAKALKLTASQLLSYDLVDAVIPEPLGGAHYDWDQSAIFLKATVVAAFNELMCLSSSELIAQRYNKFSRMGI